MVIYLDAYAFHIFNLSFLYLNPVRPVAVPVVATVAFTVPDFTNNNAITQAGCKLINRALHKAFVDYCCYILFNPALFNAI
jgi:hypothetical protein